MRFSYTDGTITDLPDMCAYCQMDTGGNHEPNCPLSWSYVPEIVTNVKVTIHTPRESMKQTIKRVIKKHRKTLDALS